MSRSHFTLGVGLLAMGLAATSTFAADNDAIDRIVVTTQLRAEDPQTVPVAVSVVDERLLEVTAPTTLLDAVALSPSFYLQPQIGGPNLATIYARGMGIAGFEKTQASPVGVTVDGLSLGTATGMMFDLFDVEQIEFNRGPQGILYGRNTSAGVVNIKRTRPTEDRGLKAAFGYGTRDLYEVKVVANTGRLFDDLLAIKIGGQYRQRDGFYRNLYLGGYDGNVDVKMLNLGIMIDPMEDLSIYLVFDYQDDESDSVVSQVGNPISANGFTNRRRLDGTPIDNIHTTWNDMRPTSVYEWYRASSELNWDLHNIGQLTWIWGYMSSTDNSRSDYDGGCTAMVHPSMKPCEFDSNATIPLHTYREQAYRQQSHELRLATDITERLRTIVGAYWFEGSVLAHSGFDFGFPVFNVQHPDTEWKSYAVFGQVEFDILENLTLAVGGRFINEDFDFKIVQYNHFSLPPLGNVNWDNEGIASVSVPRQQDKVSYTDTIYRVGLDWQVTDDLLAYISYATGFRSGGFMTRATLSELNPMAANYSNGEKFNTFDPEKVKTTELGLKSTLFDGALLLNPNFFYQRIIGQQIDFIVTTPQGPRATNTYINNIGEINGWGFELDATLDFVAFSDALDGLQLRVAGNYIDLEVDDGIIDPRRSGVRNGTPGAASDPPIDLAKSTWTLFRTPDWALTTILSYDWEIAGMPAGVSVTWRYMDDHTLTHLGLLPDRQEGYDLWNASVYLQVTENIRVGLYGFNLADEEYRTASSTSATIGTSLYGDPRTFKGVITLEF